MKELIKHIQNLRQDLSKQILDESEVNTNPLKQFESWFKDAIESNVNTPEAMVVSTVSKEGRPSARILLLRNFDEKGFVFYTNYQSRKAMDIDVNPCVAITFFWPELERQVRIEGLVDKHDTSESDKYFDIRPIGSKLGAWSSQQSRVVKNRNVLDQKFLENQEYFKNKPIPRPPFWGGYNVTPTHYEFWQGRPSRMHDRITYTLTNNRWKIERLSP